MDRGRKRPDSEAAVDSVDIKRPCPDAASVSSAGGGGGDSEMDEADVEAEAAPENSPVQSDGEGDGEGEDDGYGDGDTSNSGGSPGRPGRGRFSTLVAAISKVGASDSEKLVALTELCEALAFWAEDAAGYFPIERAAPVLVRLAGDGAGPDVMLLAVRAITYLCDSSGAAADAVVRHGVVPVLCGRLLAIEYLDVAEQCLQAFEKISLHQPVACLQGGMIVATLTYIDFFSSSIQRVAVSAIAHVCTKVPLNFSKPVMESVPTLCNLLLYEDKKLVDTVAMCLVRIVESFMNSPELLDELCCQGVLEKSLQLISSDGRTSLSHNTYTSLIGLLTKLAKSSLVAVRSLFELNISGTVRGILLSSDLNYSMTYSPVENVKYNQVHETLKLMNQLVPISASNIEDTQAVLAKEKLLEDQPHFLEQFSKDILPVLIKAVDSGANTFLCYGCALIVNNIVYASKSEMLIELLKEINISSFLASLLARKDHHVLFLALRVVEMLMKKLPDVFLGSFIKEGVVHAVEAILMQEKCHEVTSDQSNTVCQSSRQVISEEATICLCYAFDSCEPGNRQSKSCRIGSNSFANFVRYVKTSYFTHEAVNSDAGLLEILQKLKTCCAVLNETTDRSSNNDGLKCEEQLNDILSEVMMEFHGGETMSTFEFLESGLVKSLASYLSNGRYLQESSRDQNAEHYFTVLQRIQKFAQLAFKETDQGCENTLMTLLVRKLQSALTSLDNFPVVMSHAYKPSNHLADIPASHTPVLPCIRVRFSKEENESNLDNFARTLNVQIAESLEAIELYLLPKVTKELLSRGEGPSDDNATTTVENVAERNTDSTEDSSAQSSEVLRNEQATSSSLGETSTGGIVHTDGPAPAGARSKHNVPSKLIFFIKGKELDSSDTLYESILQHQMRAGPDIYLSSKFWNDVYDVTYRGSTCEEADASLSTTHHSQGSPYSDHSAFSWSTVPFFSCLLLAKLPCKLDRSSPSHDILFLLKALEGINRFCFHLASDKKCRDFSQNRIKNLDDLKVSASSIPQEEFISLKLTDKLEQQMRDPLILNSSVMPSWFGKLLDGCPFLFSFDTRCKYFRLATFGSNVHYNDATSPVSGVIRQRSRGSSNSSPRSRKKFVVSRSDVLASAAKMMASHAKIKDALEVEFFEEVGTGSGPTVEFYTLISHEFQKSGLEMWRGEFHFDLCKQADGFVEAHFGLFPRPWPSEPTSPDKCSDVRKNFFLLGQVVARALKDGRILDIHFSKAFYKLILGQALTIYDILSFDPKLGKTLLEFQAIADKTRFLRSVSRGHCLVTSDILYRDTKIEDLGIDFTLPGYADYALTPEGNGKLVDAENLEEYVAMVVDATTRSGISRQMEAFKSGFNEVFPLEALHLFTEDELERLICGDQDIWDGSNLVDHIKFDHGYTASSPPVVNLMEIIQEFEHAQRRAFLQFVTGSPRLPLGGLASLNPKLTVVRKLGSSGADHDLPSVMTCANYLKLPAYSCKETMRQRLLYAITEGQGSFHLS